MTFGIVVLSVVLIALICGAGQRILDKMRMNDKWALILVIAMIVGILIPPIKIGSLFSFSIGGFLIPFGICIYLLIANGWNFDLFRAFIGTIVTTGLILLVQWLMPSATPEDVVIDDTWLYGLIAGLVAYILGRSRRNAFICSIFGLTFASVIQFFINIANGATTPLKLGGAGAFDSMILSVLIAVGLSELIGTTAEMIVGKNTQKVFDLETGEYVELSKSQVKDVSGLYKKEKYKEMQKGGENNAK